MYIYGQPENYGLEEVAELSLSDEPYEFDIRVVWRHEETGVLYTARDSGCSCPSPFEDYTSIDQLDRVNYTELRDEARNSNASIDDRERFLDRVHAAVRAARPK
jgi:hypothetical protein